jgi:hypothetical protein
MLSVVDKFDAVSTFVAGVKLKVLALAAFSVMVRLVDANGAVLSPSFTVTV